MPGPSGVAVDLLILVVLLLVNAFFVAAEYALLRVRRAKMEALAAKGDRRAQLVLGGLKDVDRYVAGVQVGITLAGLGSGRFGEPALASILDPVLAFIFPVGLFGEAISAALRTTLSLLVITYLLVVLSELIPKAITLRFADRIALSVSRPLRGTIILFTPLVWSMNALANGVLRLLRLPRLTEKEAAYSTEELKVLVSESHRAGIFEDIERRLVQKSIDFGELRATDVMIARPDMVMLDVTLPVEELLDRVAQTTHTRLPVYEGSRDNVLGILHLQDLYRHVRTTKGPIELRPLLRPALFVPEVIHLVDLIEEFQKKRTQIAIVVGEHGGTSGLVTLEDVVEEVFGELQDALEAEQPRIQTAPDGRILVRGDVRLDEIRAEAGWDLSAGTEAETIAGFVMERLGRIARVGDVVETDRGTVRVENMARHRITQVALLRR